MTNGVNVVATYYHCSQSWEVCGNLHLGFFTPAEASDLKCPTCGKVAGAFHVIDAPLPGQESQRFIDDFNRVFQLATRRRSTGMPPTNPATGDNAIVFTSGTGACQRREFNHES
jgi:hypothetical protein